MISKNTHGSIAGSSSKKLPRHATAVSVFHTFCRAGMISALHLGLNKRVLKVPIAPTPPPTPTKALLNALVSSRSHC